MRKVLRGNAGCGMHVPDRIIVKGNDQHCGAKALPRELQLESAVVRSPDPVVIKMQTPPRCITLGDTLPSRCSSSRGTSEGDDETLLIDDNYVAHISSRHMLKHSPLSIEDQLDFYAHEINDNVRNGMVNGPSSVDELAHLREQLCRINRRIMCLEEDLAERKEKDRYFIAAGILYAALKAVGWLFRSKNQI